MAWKRVLDTTQDSPSDEFVSLSGQMHAVCDTHAGGDWTLEFKSPGDTWVEMQDDVVFDDEDGSHTGSFHHRVPRCDSVEEQPVRASM